MIPTNIIEFEARLKNGESRMVAGGTYTKKCQDIIAIYGYIKAEAEARGLVIAGGTVNTKNGSAYLTVHHADDARYMYPKMVRISGHASPFNNPAPYRIEIHPGGASVADAVRFLDDVLQKKETV